MVRLVAPTNSRRRKVGAVVNVDDSKVDALLSRGFTRQSAAKSETKTAAKKTAAKKSSSKKK